ncbi:MAG: hypothetical protein GX142_05945 [Chloroflexi bacterium]|nr:hypothetical protein [Chloroflexota bacterium]
MSNRRDNTNEHFIDYGDASATWSTRYVDPSGFECMLSLQAENGAEALKKAASVLAHLSQAQCTPLRKDSPGGSKKNTSKQSGNTVLVKPEGNAKNPVCPLHGVEMQKWARNGRTWHSHRWEDGWCNGKKS